MGFNGSLDLQLAPFGHGGGGFGKTIRCRMFGLIIINWVNESIHSYKKIIGFVPQNDIVHDNLTVEKIYRSGQDLGFFLGILFDLLDLSILPPPSGSLSSSSIEGNWLCSVVASHVTSSVGNHFHFTKRFSINFSSCLIQRVSKIFSGSTKATPSSVIGGSSKLTCGGSPTYFFKRETWKTRWIFAFAGNWSW